MWLAFDRARLRLLGPGMVVGRPSRLTSCQLAVMHAMMMVIIIPVAIAVGQHFSILGRC